jgi:parvulin-like peptidyl-prolyl isomerase
MLHESLYGNFISAKDIRMKVIKSALEEELANSLAMKKSYERELAKLPKGSLIKKNVRGHEYYYLVVRDHGKVKFAYKGKKVSDKEKQKYKQAKEYRKKYRKLLSEAKKQVKFLRSALRGKKPV